MLKVFPKQTASMHTRDGVRLDADIYRPDAEGEFPVLLMRQPYGRAIASTVVYAHPSWYAAHGYIVVIQDVRGRGTSGGEFKLFANEIADGEDTVNWAANLPGSTGNVGMYGFSYQGMTQLYAAAAKPPALKTICPAMIGYDLYTDWAYEGGAFCLQTNLAWAIQLATETARLRDDKPAYQALFAASRNLPLTNPEILQKLAPESFYHEWLAHSQPDAYWDKLSPKSYLQSIDLPMFHIGGWFDTYLRGTLHLYKDITARATTPQHYPWRSLPALGGHAAIPGGVFERSHIDCRSDVLTYTSEPLIEDLHLMGDVVVEISCSADQLSYDLCAVLCEVYFDGRVYNLTQGYLHCRDGINSVTRSIQMQTTCVRIAKGNALRLSLSAACYPAYALNSGNGAVTNSDDLFNAQIITIAVNCGGDSKILLPAIAPV